MRKGNIDLLKFIFAIVIMVYHFNNTVKQGFFAGAGYNVVTFFFLVSGYFMTATAMRKAASNGDFCKNVGACQIG